MGRRLPVCQGAQGEGKGGRDEGLVYFSIFTRKLFWGSWPLFLMYCLRALVFAETETIALNTRLLA